MPPLFVARSFALALVLGAWGACSRSESSPAPHPPPPATVGVATVEIRRVFPANELSGRIAAIQDVDIRPRVSGYVTGVSYREGSEVAAGATLFTIDARPYRAAVARANAEVARARARVELAKVEAGRAERLHTANAISGAERDALASNASQAEADLQAANAALALARLDLEFTRVRAPFAGRAGRANVSIGDYVTAGPTSTLTNLVSIDPVQVYFTGDEQLYLRQVARAEQSTVAVGLADEDGFPHVGKVDFVDNRVDASTGTVVVRAVLPNPDKRLTPGLYARVRIDDPTAIEAALVDDKAILTDQDRKFVYVLVGDTVERRDLELGRMVDGKRIVTKGLQSGDQIIVSGIQKVFPGAKAKTP